MITVSFPITVWVYQVHAEENFSKSSYNVTYTFISLKPNNLLQFSTLTGKKLQTPLPTSLLTRFISSSGIIVAFVSWSLRSLVYCTELMVLKYTNLFMKRRAARV